ncbi:hypothetical protein Agub_g4251, partial [Astrephomene gubernaculifera]
SQHYAHCKAGMFIAVLVALAFLIAWLIHAVVSSDGLDDTMDARGPPGGNVWAWRAAEAAAERNWWDVINDRQPKEEEIADWLNEMDSADFNDITQQSERLLSCACLHCGDLIPATKTCGNCKLAAYCSRDCQQRHWPRHRPRCAQLQAAAKERGGQRPPQPPPDPPLVLPASQLLFSHEGYWWLLQAHRAAVEAAVSTVGAEDGNDDDVVGSNEAAGGADEGVAASSSSSSRRKPTTSEGGESENDSPSSSCSSCSSSRRPPLVLGSPDGCWQWSWSAPPAPALLRPPRPAGIRNSGNSCYTAVAVQALLATPGLGEYLRSGAHRAECRAPERGQAPKGVSSWCPACELSNLAAAAALTATASQHPDEDGPGRPSSAAAATHGSGGSWAARTAGTANGPGGAASPAVDARGLTRQVHRLGRTLVPGRQEDAHELLTKLLEALAEVALAEAGGRGLRRALAAAKHKAQ